MSTPRPKHFKTIVATYLQRNLVCSRQCLVLKWGTHSVEQNDEMVNEVNEVSEVLFHSLLTSTFTFITDSSLFCCILSSSIRT
jgi:hypothetical protein